MAMSLPRLEWIAFRLTPFVILTTTLLALCLMTGSAWPWHHVVHEDGTRTLLATVFYFEHAARELLPDAVLAIGIAGAVRFYFPPALEPNRVETGRHRLTLGLVAIGTLAGIIVGTIWQEGSKALIDNLLQGHTRPGAPLVWGAHWRYHLIERFALLMLAFSVAGVLWRLRGSPRGQRGRLDVYAVAVAAFALLTIVFRPTAESFTDAVFLGHQLRELFTHVLVTLPLAMGTCLALSRNLGRQDSAISALPGFLDSWTPIVVTGVAAILCGAFLLIASMLTGAQSQGQATGLAALLFPHFAEHALGYILVPSLAGTIYLVGSN